MADDASSPCNSRRAFLRSASWLAVSGCALPLSALARTSELPRVAAPTDLLEEFGYGEVRLAPGLAQSQFEHTQRVMLRMNVDSLLKPYRLRAGLAGPGPEMGGWYDLVSDAVRAGNKDPYGGHGFAPGHAFGQWISALARGYAASGHPEARAKVEQILAAYEPAISGRFYANFPFPAYNYDKIVCGLIDAHSYCRLGSAYPLLDRTTDVAEPHLPPRALDRGEPQKRWRQAIGESTSGWYLMDESYTLGENLFLAWQRQAGRRYLPLAKRFLLDDTYFAPLAAGVNVLPDHHAYSYANALNSAVQAYISTGSRMHLDAARNGFAMIAAQSFATGGWGPEEYFRNPRSDDLYTTLTTTHRGFETPCGSYAHLKLTRYLLRITRDGRYGDSMEQVFLNTVLGAKRLEHDGHAFYYSDYNFRGARTYFPDRWPCCSGTLPQVAADYHVLIYFRDPRGVYVNLYTPSAGRWRAADGTRLALVQSGDYANDGHVRLDLKASRETRFRLRLRIPGWSQLQGGSPSLRVNGRPVPVETQLGFAALERTWKDGDSIDLELPMPVRLVPINAHHPDVAALVRGPQVLFALAQQPKLSRGQLLSVKRADGGYWQAGDVRFAPFTAIGEAPYSTYVRVT
ncbi:MAG TPA: beta-L-arabinofuranosidase domain-containing protein [Steroidobacteraceae bacterium]|nr:beta-L-arabinofuranosidase domain-containing protein [Steroidobacteraceae bacterium]